MKKTPPWSRLRSTQPQSWTAWPAWSARRSPHPWLRMVGTASNRGFSHGGGRGLLAVLFGDKALGARSG
jgi:hypothetical protein